jgi:hypothetical protein
MLGHKNYCEISQELQMFNRHEFSLGVELSRLGKILEAGHFRAGTDRSICSRTMGVVHDTGMQLTRVREKLSLQDLYPRQGVEPSSFRSSNEAMAEALSVASAASATGFSTVSANSRPDDLDDRSAYALGAAQMQVVVSTPHFGP